MISRTLSMTALAATTAHAILLPPNMAAASFGEENLMALPVDPHKRSVAVECPSCAFATKTDDVLSWKENAGSTYMLDFQVGAHEDTVDVNGVEIYPPSWTYFLHPLYVTQVDPGLDENLKLRVTQYKFHYTKAHTVSEEGMELLPITLQINSIEGTTVNPPTITVNLLKDANGSLKIASFHADNPQESDGQCNRFPILCKWRAALANRLSGLRSSVTKGCHRMHLIPAPSETMEQEDQEDQERQDDSSSDSETDAQEEPTEQVTDEEPVNLPSLQGLEADPELSDSDPALAQDPHQAHHPVHVFVRRVFFAIMIPVILGIFAGTLTYLIGMALGSLIALAVFKIRGRGPYERVALDEEGTEQNWESDEKEAYVVLPAYDSPPVYDEDDEDKEAFKDTQ